jgi:hypothetical protein
MRWSPRNSGGFLATGKSRRYRAEPAKKNCFGQSYPIKEESWGGDALLFDI